MVGLVGAAERLTVYRNEGAFYRLCSHRSTCPHFESALCFQHLSPPALKDGFQSCSFISAFQHVTGSLPNATWYEWMASDHPHREADQRLIAIAPLPLYPADVTVGTAADHNELPPPARRPWVVEESLLPGFRADLTLEEKQVRDCDTSLIEERFGDLAKRKWYCRQWQGSARISFPEFEDAEIVFLVPEVKAFWERLHRRIRHLWYFLSARPEDGNLLMFLAVHAEPNDLLWPEAGIVGVAETPALEQLLLDRLRATATFADSMDDDAAGILGQIVAPLPDPTQARLLRNALQIS
jgi:hypothetical protein